jgi:hypothetical protein
MNLIAGFVVDLASEETHRHAALAADETKLGLSLRGQSLFHSVYLVELAIDKGEYIRFDSAHELASNGEGEQRGLHGTENSFEQHERLRGAGERLRLRLL